MIHTYRAFIDINDGFHDGCFLSFIPFSFFMFLNKRTMRYLSQKFILLGLLTLISTIIYYILSHSGKHFNIGPLNFTDSVYFTVNSIGMIGYGDIFPISPLSKWITSGMIVAFLWILLHDLP